MQAIAKLILNIGISVLTVYIFKITRGLFKSAPNDVIYHCQYCNHVVLENIFAVCQELMFLCLRICSS